MKHSIPTFLLLLAIIFEAGLQVVCEPDADPGPSPVADPGRNQNQARRPTITRQPINTITKRFTPAKFECLVDGNPNPTVTWLKDGKPFTGNAEAHLLPTNELMFYKAKSSDQGTYQCVARNTKGVAKSRNVTLQIAYIKDDFRTIPSDRVVAVGETAELRCEGPRGNPKPDISWKKNGNAIAPNGARIRIERGKLIISGATKSDNGEYKCVAKNLAGTKETIGVILSVHEPPVFTATPQDKTIVAGEDLELTCEAKGDPKPRIRWDKSDGSLSSRVANLPNGNLRITNVQSEDAGEYVCNAKNVVKEISASATVTVNVEPRFINPPEDTTATVGSTVSIPCSVEGKPEPTVIWHMIDGPNMFRGNSYLGGHITIKMNGELTIYNVKFSDQGKYKCEVINQNGRPISAEAELTVLSRRSNINPPVIKQGPRNMTVTLGSNVQLECTSSAVPVPDYSWSKGSEQINTGNRFTVASSGTLKISNIQNEDAGRYTCTATNDFGRTQWDAWITVKARGLPTTPPVSERDLPSAPSTPILVNVTSSSISLKWTASSRTGASSISGYILEYYCLQCGVSTWTRVPTGMITQTTFTTNGLEESSKYVFLVRAQNQQGISDPSEVSDAFTTKGTSSSDEQISQISVQITSIRPSSSGHGIVLEWDRLKICDIIDGYKIYAKPVSIENGDPVDKTVGCYANYIDLTDLESRVYYELRVCPYKGEVKGRFSPMVLAHPQSGDIKMKPMVLKVDLKFDKEDTTATGTFSWTPPPNILPKYITQYTFRCYDKDNAKEPFDITKKLNGTKTSFILPKLPRGRDFTANIVFSTVLGEGIPGEDLEFSVPASDAGAGGMSDIVKNPAVLAGIAACVLLIIVIIVGVLLYRRHRKNRKLRGLPGRSMQMDPFQNTQYHKGFTMSLANAGGNNNYSDGTGSSSGHPNGGKNMFMSGMSAPPSMARNTTVSLNNSNGNVGTALSPEMGNVRSAPRHGSSFSYVADQLTNMSNIHPQFSSPTVESRAQAHGLSAAEIHQQLQQQQYHKQISETATTLADEFVPQGDLIDMNTPTNDARYASIDNELPPPPPSPPMSQKTTLSDKTNRSRGSSRNSTERGSSHSNKGRRSRERNRGFQPVDRVPTDTDTGIDSPQQTPSPPRPSDLRADHYSSSMPANARTPGRYPYAPTGSTRLPVQYQSGDPALGYLGGPSETESDFDGNQRTHYISLPEEVRNSVTASSVSMMNRYDSDSNCSDRSSSPESVASFNMESVSQVGMNRNVVPQQTNSAFVPVQAPYETGDSVQNHRGGFQKPKVPKKQFVNGHYDHVYDQQTKMNNAINSPEQFFNRVNSASSSSSSSYHQNTADSGMSAGVGSYGHNSLNSNSSGESGPKSQMSRSRTTGSFSAENQSGNAIDSDQSQMHFPSADRRYIPSNDDIPESQMSRGRPQVPVPQKRAPRMGTGSKSPQRKNSQDSSLSLPPRDGSTYLNYEEDGLTDSHVMLPEEEYYTNEEDIDATEESRTAFLTAKSVFAGNSLAQKNLRGRHPELSDVPEVSTSDFYSDRSQ